MIPKEFVSWKDKILDYEIETRRTCMAIYGRMCSLEKIRFSITRLKPTQPILDMRATKPWKDKILDYEIET